MGNRFLYLMVDSFSKQVVTVKRMSPGEAMMANLLNSTQYAKWTREYPPDDYTWALTRNPVVHI